MMVRYEDGKWINNIGVYFAILVEINEDLLQLIKHTSRYDEKIELLFFKLAVNLNRLLPIKHKKLSEKDGILRLKESIDFLYPDYQEIYNCYKNSILIINDVRNKFEHVPHVIKWKEYTGTSQRKELCFINDEYISDIFDGNEEAIKEKKRLHQKLEWQIDTEMFVGIVISLDDVFVKIQNKLYSYFEDNAEALAHPYISGILNLRISNYINELNNI